MSNEEGNAVTSNNLNKAVAKEGKIGTPRLAVKSIENGDYDSNVNDNNKEIINDKLTTNSIDTNDNELMTLNDLLPNSELDLCKNKEKNEIESNGNEISIPECNKSVPKKANDKISDKNQQKNNNLDLVTDNVDISKNKDSQGINENIKMNNTKNTTTVNKNKTLLEENKENSEETYKDFSHIFEPVNNNEVLLKSPEKCEQNMKEITKENTLNINDMECNINSINIDRNDSDIETFDDEDPAIDPLENIEINMNNNDVKSEEEDFNDINIKEEFYEMPTNFLELANHFMNTQARVVLSRVIVYKCSECPSTFASHRDRALHKVRHVRDHVTIKEKKKKTSKDSRFIKHLQCPECDYCFVQQSTLNTHMRLHEPFPHVCHCGIGYYKEQDLVKHSKLVHNETKPLSTWKPIINLKKVKPSEINRGRIKIEEPDDLITQEVELPTTFSRFGRTQKRLVTVMEQGSESDFSDEDNYLIPSKKKNNKTGKVFRKTVIKSEKGPKTSKRKHKVIKSENGSKIGKRKYYYNQKPVTCHICYKVLKNKKNFIGHLSTHSDERNFSCVVCDKAFKTAISRRNHFYNVHAEKSYQCSFCDKMFSSKVNMKTHERIHMQLKLFKCKFCEKSFTDRSASNRHERTHTGETPYQCEFCPKAFGDASQAIIHRLRHKNVRRFQCRMCTKSFITQVETRNHELKHNSKNKNIECDYCNKKFFFKGNLISHIKHVHMPKQYAHCKICRAKLVKHQLRTHMKNIHDIVIKGHRVERVVGTVKIEVED